METMMASTGWRDLVIHLTEGAQLVFDETAFDRTAMQQWAAELAEERLLWNDEPVVWDEEQD